MAFYEFTTIENLISYLRSMSPSNQYVMTLELVPPGQQPIIKITTAWVGCTWKASERANAVKGIIPNWHRKPIKMPHGRQMCAQSLCTSTVHPMENMTMASMTVSTVLKTVLRMMLKSFSGTRHDVLEHTVALAWQVGIDVAMNPVLWDVKKKKKQQATEKQQASQNWTMLRIKK